MQVHDDFKDGVQFDDILALYVFDKRLRLLLLDAIERIEVSLRVAVALELGKHDAEAHLKPHFLHGTATSIFNDWQKKYAKAFHDSREDFAMHFKEKYPRSDMPIWMATELWDFGMLSKYVGNLKDAYKKPIAARYQLERVELLKSWLHSINVVRNICAHHGRLWNRVMVAKPKYPAHDDALLLRPMVEQHIPANRIFATMCIIQYFMHYISPNSSWKERVTNLIDAFPASPHINVGMMGVPESWQNWALWQ